MPVNNFDPDWFVLSLAWRDLTWQQKKIIVWRARLYMFKHWARRVCVIALAEVAGVIGLVPSAFYWLVSLVFLEVF